MKKIYICAALGLFFASCSTEEGTKESRQDLETVNVVGQTNWLDIMNAIDGACVTSSYKTMEEMIVNVENVAFANSDFQKLNMKGYVTPTVSELESLLNNDEATILGQLNYSDATNYYLNQMLVVRGPWETNPATDKGVSNKDKELLIFLSSAWGPDDDWEWNKKKPIAFVKGYKDSLARAIVLSVMSEQAEKIEKVN